MLLAADNAGEIRLLGVTCVGGNTRLQSVCRNTLRMLRAANRLDIPVFSGAECPIVSERPVRNTHHGEDGFGDLDRKAFTGDDTELDGLLQEENAVVALNKIVSENKGEVTLVCLAPLTNVALAVRTYPAFRGLLRDVHIMGGNIRGLGNTTPTAEFNFRMDPEAAHVVLESVTCPVQLTPLEPCYEHPVELDWRLSVLPSLADGGLAMDLLTAAESSVLGRRHKTEWVCFDQLAVAALLRPDLVRRAHVRHVSVELAGTRTRGQMVPTCVSRGQCPDQCPGSPVRLNAEAPPVRVLEAFDVEAFKRLLVWCASRWTRRK